MALAVIIAPHSQCESIYRDCDRRASQAAEILRDLLISKGIKTIKIDHETLRSDQDLNRLPARYSAPRRRLRQAIDSSDKVYLLEMHSFPGEDFGGSKIAILNLPENIPVAKQLAFGIDGISVHVGSYTNDIQNEYLNRAGVLPFLLEVNEDREALSDAELAEMLAKIANKLRQIHGGCQVISLKLYLVVAILVALIILFVFIQVNVVDTAKYSRLAN